jgi:hypothetical protein
MNLSDLASIASVVSSVAVLVSLTYLAQQMRQNAKHTRALIQQGRINRITDQQLRMADPDLCASWLAGNGAAATPKAIRERQFELQCSTMYFGLEDTVAQHRDGLISDEQFESFRNRLRHRVRMSPGWLTFIEARQAAETGPVEMLLAELLAQSDGGTRPGSSGSGGPAAPATSRRRP